MKRTGNALCVLLMALAAAELAALHGCGNTGGGGGRVTTTSGSGLPRSKVPMLALASANSAIVISNFASGTAALTATVLDSQTHLPMTGVPIAFFTSTGTLAEAAVVSNMSGTASDLLTVPAGTALQSADVSAHAHGAGQSIEIPIANVAALAMAASPPFLQCGNSQPGLSVVSVTALSSGNTPLPGVSIAFSAQSANVTPIAITDLNGVATATVSAPPGLPDGSAKVTAEAAGLSASIGLSVTGCAAQPTASAVSTPIPPNTPATLQFVGAFPSQIGVLQSGLPEQSTVTFKVVNGAGVGLEGVNVNFFISSVGGETLSPASGATTADGTVSTTLSSGHRAGSIEVTASTGSILAVSSPITIFGGLPVQGRMGLSAQFQNIAGAVTAGVIDPLRSVMSDRFGNPAQPGATVEFQSLGGAAQSTSLSDNNGVTSGTLIAEPPLDPTDLKGNPTNGIITVLTTTRGETPFIDLNGNGVWDPGEPIVAVPEPFFDLNGNGVRDANEPFVDLNGSGVYDNDQSGGKFSQNIAVFTSMRVTFSGATTIAISPPQGFIIPNGGSQNFSLQLVDGFDNPLVAGTTYKIEVSPAGSVQGNSGTVPDGESFGKLVPGLNLFTFTVNDSDSINSPVPITITVTVDSPPSNTAPGGNGSTSVQIGGTMN
jgi:hypothetical protein